MSRGTLGNAPPGRMVSLDGKTTLGVMCGHCSAPAVMRLGNQIGVYIDDTTPNRRFWIETALVHHPDAIVFVGIGPGETRKTLEHHATGVPHVEPPRLVRLKEHLPWGMGPGPGMPMYGWREYGAVPDCGEGHGFILQLEWHGFYGHRRPSLICRQTIKRQAKKHNPRWTFWV